jgi:hypothetical protein
MKTATFQTLKNDGTTSIISIDNTSEFKDFNIETSKNKVSIQIDKTTNTLTIEDCELSGIELELFKNFLLQLS